MSTDPADIPRGTRNSFVVDAQPWAGGASDVGLRHFPNQDALAIAAALDSDDQRVAVVAVCDGVSSSSGSEHASVLASDVACSTVATRLSSDETTIVADAIAEAFEQANAAIAASADVDAPTAWSTTLIVAVLAGGEIVVGSAGDSRAYWFGDDGTTVRLTRDDSMAQARIDLGVRPDEAESGPGAHTITKWLGVGSPDPTPTTTRHHPEGSGWLCVCSDGLWNHASSPEDLGRVLTDAVRPGDDAWRIAGRLVDWANEQGGQDNVSVALVHVV